MKSANDTAVSAASHASYVLIADGDIVRSASYLEALEPMRVGALVARDGNEAMQILERFGPPNVLVISLSLTRRDPFAVMGALRSIAGPHHAGIIALGPPSVLHRISREVRHDLGISSVLPHIAGAATVRAAVGKAFDETGMSAPAGSVEGVEGAASASPRDVVGEILHDLTTRATRLIEGAGSVVYVRTNESEAFRASVDWRSDRVDGPSPFAAPYAFEWVSRTGDVLVIPDFTAQSMFSGETDTLRDVVRALVAVPLIGDKNRVVGALCIFDVKPLIVTAPQLEALKALGRDFGFLIESQSSDLTTSIEGARRPVDASTATAPTIAVDPVTGLLTRDSGHAVFMYEAARARDERRPISVILIAPDQSDLVIQGWRPDVGDRVLRTLSQAARVMLRASDVAMRWGPDEFLIVLPMVSVSTAHDVAERLREAAQRIRVPDLPPLTVSGGLTELPPGVDPGGALERVQKQLDAARRLGGNRIL